MATSSPQTESWPHPACMENYQERREGEVQGVFESKITAIYSPPGTNWKQFLLLALSLLSRSKWSKIAYTQISGRWAVTVCAIRAPASVKNAVLQLKHVFMDLSPLTFKVAGPSILPPSYESIPLQKQRTLLSKFLCNEGILLSDKAFSSSLQCWGINPELCTC